MRRKPTVALYIFARAVPKVLRDNILIQLKMISLGNWKVCKPYSSAVVMINLAARGNSQALSFLGLVCGYPKQP